MGDFGYTTQIYHLKLEMIYNEDDKIVESQNLILGIEPPNYPPLRDRCFLYTPDQVNTNNLEDYSEINQAILEEIAKIQALHNPILEQILLTFHSQFFLGAMLCNAPT